MKRVLLSLLMTATSATLAQDFGPHPGIHEMESRLHAADTTAASADTAWAIPRLLTLAKRAALTRHVLGWHPWWASSTAYLSYDYSAMTHIAYFSYETDTTTGGYKSIHSWNSTPIIDYAHARGVKVLLTVTNFGNAQNSALLSDTARQNTMITTLISLLKARNGDGVNFDLESIPAAQRSNLVSFMRRAANAIRAQVPGAEISMATPAVDWSDAWDYAQLGQICDALVMMGYNYYWSGSTTAGPVAPLVGGKYNVTNSVMTYLNAGVAPERLWLGVPWYGYDFVVTSSARMSPTVSGSTASSRTYAVAEPMAATYGKTFDGIYDVPWFSYQSSTWRQVWYDDSMSLGMKYAMAIAKNLGGIGIWALSYDGGRPEIWSGIKAAFTPVSSVSEPSPVPVSCTLEPNYPNPFNPSTRITVDVTSPQEITLDVYDPLGRRVAVLFHGAVAAGRSAFEWNAAGCASGVYFARLSAGEISQTRPMLLMR